MKTIPQVTSNNTSKFMQPQSDITSSASSNVAGTSIANGLSELSQQVQQCSSDKICFNFGKELYVYTYRGVKKVLVYHMN